MSSLRIRSFAALNADVAPLLVGDYLHLRGEDFASDEWDDYITNDTFEPLPTDTFASATAPTTGTHNGRTFVKIEQNKTLVCPSWDRLIGVADFTAYCLMRANSVPEDGVLCWIAGGLNNRFVVQRPGFGQQWRFSVRAGTTTDYSASVDRSLGGFGVVSFGRNTAGDIKVGWNTTFVSVAASAPVTAGTNHAFNLGQHPTNVDQFAAIDVIDFLIFRGDHNTARRTAVVNALLAGIA